jgi:hypothetical protein
MDDRAESTSPSTFPLRLPKSMRGAAMKIAEEEGLSLNHFIALAVAEKIVRMETAEKQSNLHLRLVPRVPHEPES